MSKLGFSMDRVEFVLILILMGATFYTASVFADDDDTVWLYAGGWSHHAAGVSYSTQTHETIGLEYNDWVAWSFTNSNEDQSYFVGKAIETRNYWGVDAGMMFGCVKGYTDECLPMIMPKVGYTTNYVGFDITYLPGVVYKATLRFPLYVSEKPKERVKEKAGPWSIYYVGGTTGLGYGARYHFSDTWSVSLESTGYDVDPDWGSAEIGFTTAAVSWHPWQNGFFLTSGLAYNETAADYSREWERTFTVLDYSATISASAEATFEYAPVSGYFGLGYEHRPEHAHDLGYRFELGVVTTGNPEVEGSARVHGIPELDDVAQAFADAKLREIREAYSYSFWPVAKLAITYHF